MLSTIALLYSVPQRAFSDAALFSWGDVGQLMLITAAFAAWLAPFDFLGGFLLPNHFGRSKESLKNWFGRYLYAVVGQASLFVLFSICILSAGRLFGFGGVLMVLFCATLVCFLLRHYLLTTREVKTLATTDKLQEALTLIQSWDVFVPKVMVVEHRDIGFTGGVVGFGNNAQIVVPRLWLDQMSVSELATAIARRAVAIDTGGYTTGLFFSLIWNVGGFVLCTFLPGANLVSVAGLLTVICGFTLWSFVGLLTLPTLSRKASLQIDRTLMKLGAPPQLIAATAMSQDEFQDGERDRPKWIETIFHPVPNVASRNEATVSKGVPIWNVARTTLFFSWACIGLLSRAVHCNVGRPELWTMLPTD